MIRQFPLWCLALALSCALAAKAQDKVMRAEHIQEQQRAIRANMEAGKEPYATMSRAKKQSILSNQKKLDALLEGITDTSQLDARDRGKVFELVSRIDASIAGTDGNRVCTQEARTGSNYMTRVCRTQAEIREQKEASQKMLGEERGRMKCSNASGCM